jgi:arylsulfatase A-like enzyme/Flp pilus assembly protein TadD
MDPGKLRQKNRHWFVKWMIAAGMCAIVGIGIMVSKKSRPRQFQAIDNVLIITLDTTRADRIGAYGYRQARTPNIDRFAEQGILFENAYSPVPLTLPAHCSLFTGTYPPSHQVRNNGNYALARQVQTLAETLLDHKFQTAAFISSFVLDSRFGLNQGFETFDDHLTAPGKIKLYSTERRAEETFLVFSSWLEHRRAGRFFVWIHFYDPHFPYTPPEPFASQFSNNPYDGEIAYMDQAVGKVFARLQETGALEQTLIVLVGDHGEAFGEHGEFGHQIFCYQENLRIPLILYANDQSKNGWKMKQQTNLVDVMPTILDILGIPIPSSIQGESLLPLIRDDRTENEGKRDIYFESRFPYENMGCAAISGLLHGRFKWIDLPKSELYDVVNDPKEKSNLILPKNILAREMKRRFDDLRKKISEPSFDSTRRLSPAEMKRLETLGYLSIGNRQTESSIRTDPKDRIAAFTVYTQATRFDDAGDAEKAEEGYLQSIRMNPEFGSAYGKLGDLYGRLHRYDDGVKIYSEGIRKAPGETHLKIQLAAILIALNRFDEALSILTRLENESGPDFLVRTNLLAGEIWERKRRFENAIACYQKAHNIESDNPEITKKLLYLLHGQNRFSEALQIYHQLEDTNPEDGRIVQDMAILYARTGDLENADIYFKKAMALKHDPKLFFDYAVILSRKKDYQNAILYLKRFLDFSNPEDPLTKTAQQAIKDLAEKNPH